MPGPWEAACPASKLCIVVIIIIIIVGKLGFWLQRTPEWLKTKLFKPSEVLSCLFLTYHGTPDLWTDGKSFLARKEISLHRNLLLATLSAENKSSFFKPKTQIYYLLSKLKRNMSPRPGGILYQNLSNFCNISLPNVNYLLAKMITKKITSFSWIL